MPANFVVSLLQDDQGYLWIGTTDGVCRFDGTDFVTYASDARVPGRIIYQIFQANDSLLLLATSSGLAVFEERHERYRNELITDTLLRVGSGIATVSIARATDRRILVSGGYALHLLDRDLRSIARNRVYDKPTFIPNFMRDPLYAAADSSVILLSCHLPQGRVAEVTVADLSLSFPDSILNVIALDASQYSTWGMTQRSPLLILCSEELGFTSIDLRTHERYTCRTLAPGGIPFTVRTKIVEDPYEPVVWLGSDQGLLRFDHQRRTVEVVIAEAVSELMMDKDGTLWVGTPAGLVKVPALARAVRTFEHSRPGDLASLKKPFLHHLCVDDYGRIWVSSWKSGLHQWNKDGTYVRHYDRTKERPAWSNVWSIVQAGTELYASTGSGVDRFDPQRQRFVTATFFPDSLSRQLIGGTDLLVDAEGVLWVGLTYRHGILRYDRTTGRTEVLGPLYPAGDDRHFPFEGVTSMAPDRGNGIWFAGRGNDDPLIHWDRRTNTYAHVPIMADGHWVDRMAINQLLVDRRDVLWIATNNHGLLRYDPAIKSWDQYDGSDGLPGVEVIGLAIDREGLLWVCSNNGLAVWEPSTRRFRSFTSYDSPFFRSVAFLAFPFKDDPDRLIFSSKDELVTADRRDLLRAFASPPVLIDHVVVDDEVLSAEGPQRFAHDRSHFSFQFAAVDLRTEGRASYAYMLEGWDKGWTTTTDRSANYAHVPPGTYTFNVRLARDRDAAAAAHFTFTIAPPFYRTWWFALIALAATAGLLYALHLARLHQVLRVERLRSRLSRDLHDDIGSTLSSISILSTVARKRAEAGDSEGAAASLAGISERSQRVQREMNDIVWSVDPKKDSMEELLIRMREFCATVLEPKGIAFHFDASGEMPASLRPEVKSNLYLIFKEAVNNAAKHANASRVLVHLRRDGDGLRMRIEDDGAGFSADGSATNGGGNGMRNMRQRAAEMNAGLHIGPGKERGVMVDLQLRT